MFDKAYKLLDKRVSGKCAEFLCVPPASKCPIVRFTRPRAAGAFSAGPTPTRHCIKGPVGWRFGLGLRVGLAPNRDALTRGKALSVNHLRRTTVCASSNVIFRKFFLFASAQPIRSTQKATDQQTDYTRCRHFVSSFEMTDWL